MYIAFGLYAVCARRKTYTYFKRHKNCYKQEKVVLLMYNEEKEIFTSHINRMINRSNIDDTPVDGAADISRAFDNDVVLFCTRGMAREEAALAMGRVYEAMSEADLAHPFVAEAIDGVEGFSFVAYRTDVELGDLSGVPVIIRLDRPDVVAILLAFLRGDIV